MIGYRTVERFVPLSVIRNMHGIKVLLALGLLLATASARPEGNGVKGGRNHKSMASAGAISQVTAHANGGFIGTAESSATATANADTSDCPCNAHVDGGNIEKVISSDDANRNVDPLGDSDDLGLSSDRAKDSEKESNDRKEGTLVWDHRNANTGSHGNSGSVGVTGQSQDHRPGCGAPGGVEGHRGASGCTDKNVKDSKLGVSNPYPTYNEHPDLSAGSSNPVVHDGGYGGNNSGARPCTSGASGCPRNKPSVANPYPTYNEHPDLSAGSSNPVVGDGGYGGNNSGARPCTSGASGCPRNKPSVSNPYPTYNEHPDLSAGSSNPVVGDDGYGGNSGARPCTSGASGCPRNKPSVSNPYPTYNEHPDLSAGSLNPVVHDDGYGGNSGARPCTSGASDCPRNKPSVANPHPTYNEHPDLSAGSSNPVVGDGGYGGNNSGARPCTSGTSGCPRNKPSVSNPYPTYHENPDLSGGSKHPTNFNGGYGDKAATTGENDSSGSSKYPGSSRKPDTSNPFLNGEIDVSAIKHSGNPSEGPELPDFKTNPSNPFLNPHSQVRSPTGTKHSENPNGSYGGSSAAPRYPHGGSPGDSELPIIKTNPSNPFLSHHGNVYSTNGIKHTEVSSSIPQKADLPSAEDRPATNSDCHGSASCTPLNKSTGHPPTAFEHPRKSPEYQSADNKPNPSNPFLPHNGEAERTTVTRHPDLKPPVLKNPGSFGEGSYDLIDPHSNVNENTGSQSSVTEGHGIPSTTENHGEKSHQPGVKGGSRRGAPAQLQGSPGLGMKDSGSGNTGSAYSTAHADASASAYSSAHASGSSSSEGGHSSAKSETYGDLGNSWAWSSASSSASAFASSSSHQASENWEHPQILDVPAE